jgi:hypothetical protein
MNSSRLASVANSGSKSVVTIPDFCSNVSKKIRASLSLSRYASSDSGCGTV